MRVSRTLRTSLALAGISAATALGLVVAGQPSTAVVDDAPGTGVVTKEPAAAKRAPALRVTTVVTGLSHPWDIKPLPDGSWLMTERDPARLSLVVNGKRRTVAFPTGKVWTSGETGLMGLAVDREFSENRRFYTCSGWRLPGGDHDVRVNAWTLSKNGDRARLVKALVSGFPTTSGRHGGCRLLMTGSGALVVGTGDAAVGTNPRNKASLGGKTLRLDPRTGKPLASNPFAKSKNAKTRYLLTYGHRNVQGLAQRADGSLWSVEHGSYRDDEVNKLKAGGDYGWNPVPGYDESVPMTDQSLPGKQIAARWRSGNPTIATSGATFLYGDGWGAYQGTLAVAALAAEKLVFIKFDKSGRLVRTYTPAALNGDYGRLRTATLLPDGSLLVLTDGYEGQDKVLRVSPR